MKRKNRSPYKVISMLEIQLQKQFLKCANLNSNIYIKTLNTQTKEEKKKTLCTHSLFLVDYFFVYLLKILVPQIHQ